MLVSLLVRFGNMVFIDIRLIDGRVFLREPKYSYSRETRGHGRGELSD